MPAQVSTPLSKTAAGFSVSGPDGADTLANVVAQGFIDSPEFASKYGNLTNEEFVMQLYKNVLHREPDAGGLKFHIDNLNAGRITRADDLAAFADSPENQAALIGVIGNGFAYVPYAG